MSTAQTMTETKSSMASTIKSTRPSGEQEKHMIRMPSEAQWMLSVLDDISAKLALVSHLTPEIMKDKLIDALDPDVVIALRVHFQIEKQFENLLQQKASQGSALNASESLAEEESPASLDAQLAEVAVCALDSVRTVADILADNALLVRRMRELRTDAGQSSRAAFLHVMGRLRAVTAGQLRLTADEQHSLQTQLAGFAQREAEDQKRFCALSDQLASHRARHAQVLQGQHARIAQLRQEVDAVRAHSASASEQLSSALTSGTEAIASAGAAEEQRLARELQALQAKLETGAGDHYRTQAQRLRQRDLRLGEVASTIAGYDEQMRRQQNQLRKLALATDRDARTSTTLQKWLDSAAEHSEATAAAHSTLCMNRELEAVEERRRHDNRAVAQELHAGFLARKAQEEKLLAKITQMKKQGLLKPGQSIAGALREAQANGGVIKQNKK